MRRLGLGLFTTLAFFGTLPAGTASATTPVAVGSTAVYPVVQATTEPVGNVTLTESAPGQLAVGDVITIRLKDSAGAASLHMTTTPVVSGTNGLGATLAVASSSGTLQDEVVLTVSQSSSGSAFPGVLTVAQLNPAIDVAAATGNVTAFVSDTSATIAAAGTPASAVVANVITAVTLKASFTPVTEPTLNSTGSNQTAGNITIAEPAKDFFKTGDVITFRVRDVNGSADTIGLATTPFASGGAMSVSVHGLNTATVQPNETGFTVSVDAQDPSNGSTSSLVISNIVLNTAQAPSGPVTVSATVTTGATTEYIAPGRVPTATIGGATATSSAGDPLLTVPSSHQVAGNLTVTAAAGALRAGDTFSVAIQEAGVTYTTANPPITSLTAGNLSLTAAVASLDAGAVTATWTVQNPNTVPSTIVIGPIYYDVSSGAVSGDKVSVKLSGGGSFTSQTVTDGTLTSAVTGVFTASLPAPSTSSNSPVVMPGTDVHFTESAPGALTANNSAIVLLSPYASQIAAYRTTFAATPSATATGITLGAPVVNTQTISVTTANGVVSAPPQTVVIFPVTAASTGSPGQVTFTGISYQLGHYVPPGALVGTGTANSGTGLLTAASSAVAGTVVSGNQYVDLIDGNGLGSASSGDTTPPETYLDGGPADGSTVFNTSSVTLYFHSSEDPYSTFMCTLVAHTTAGDTSTTIENHCGQPSNQGGSYIYSKTYPSLADGSYTFYVQATDANNNTDPTPATTSFNIGFDNTAPTATVTSPKTLTGPVVIAFNEPVKGISGTNLTISPAVAGGSLVSCVNGSMPSDCAAGPVTKASIVPSVGFTPGQSYHVELDAPGALPAITDLAGNALADTTSTFRGSLNEQETSTAATTTWRVVSTTAASGGSYSVAHLAGASASYQFSGTSVSWITVTGKSQGKATMYIDGVKKLAVNNYASSTHYGIARTVTGLSATAHTLKIVVAGAKGSTSGTDTQVAVDSFVVAGSATQDTNTAVRYTWRIVAATSASGGHYAGDDLATAAISFRFASTSVTWWTVTAPSMGKAAVYVDGVKKATIDNYSSATRYGVKHTFGGLASGTHTLKIVVLGTHRSGASGSSIAVDRWTVT